MIRSWVRSIRLILQMSMIHLTSFGPDILTEVLCETKYESNYNESDNSCFYTVHIDYRLGHKIKIIENF